MKYGKVLTYKDIEEAKKLIGKKVIANDHLNKIEKVPEECFKNTLTKITTDITYPFDINGLATYQFIREVIDEPQYRPYTYEEAKVFIGDRVKVKSDYLPFGVEEQIKLITSVTKETNGVQIMGVSAEIFLKKYEWLDGNVCGVEVKE